MNDRKWSRDLAKVRSISSNFDHGTTGRMGYKKKADFAQTWAGEIGTLPSIGHDADFINYFRWSRQGML